MHVDFRPVPQDFAGASEHNLWWLGNVVDLFALSPHPPQLKTSSSKLGCLSSSLPQIEARVLCSSIRNTGVQQ